ncbi:MAG: hypothetical protein H7A01_18300 [Hahellaceae bacterium]|jgi:hypothetical protein|nr:hypothetical protein [Hahellaceae bacterium]MCP5213040.1 hypothetical protein [Hahellaceae bacterium]
MNRQSLRIYTGALIAGFLAVVISLMLTVGQQETINNPNGERFSKMQNNPTPLKSS